MADEKPMEKRVLRFPAPPGSFFTPEAAEGLVGQEFPMTMLGREVGRARVVGTELEAGGAAIVAELESEDFPAGYAVTEAIRLNGEHGVSMVKPELIL